MLAHEVVDRVIGVDRLSGVAPKTVENLVFHGALLDVPVVDVGDLELAAPRGFERGDDVPDLGVVQVDPGHRVLARWIGRLLDDSCDPARWVDGRHSEMVKMIGLLHTRQQDASTAWLRLEMADGIADGIFHDVVGEDDNYSIAG